MISAFAKISNSFDQKKLPHCETKNGFSKKEKCKK
jgi:hypothetical protein